METFNATNQSSTSWSAAPTTSNITEDSAVSSPPGGPISVHMIIISTFLLTFATVSAVSNFLVLLSYKFEKKLQSNFQILIRNQAAADIIVCTVPMPLCTLYILMGYWPFGRVMCGLVLLLHYGACIASVYALVAICVDRLWATKCCHHYRKYNTKKKVAIMCFIAWLSSATTVGYPMISDRVLRTRDNECQLRVEENQEFLRTITVTVIVIPSIFVIASYSIVYHAIRKLAKTRPEDKHTSPRRRKVAQQSPAAVKTDKGEPVQTTYVKDNAAENSAENGANFQSVGTNRDGGASKNNTKLGQKKNEDAQGQKAGSTRDNAQASKPKQKADGKRSSNKGRKSFITLSYIVLAYMICYVPLAITENVLMVSPEIVSADMHVAVYWMTYVNSALNPFMYAFSSAEFRSTAIKMLKFSYCKQPQ